MRLAIGLGANSGDLGRHIEQRMGDLARHHVDLVIQGHGNDHVSLFGTCPCKHIGMRAMTDMAANIELVLDILHKLR